MQITAKADYAIRAMCELATSPSRSSTRAQIAEAQGIPGKFLEVILADLKRSGLTASQRGSGGGYVLICRPSDVNLADIVRAVDGPLASVRGLPPEETAYEGAATHLRDVWIALRSSLRAVLEETTLQDVIDGTLPDHVADMTRSPGAWTRR